MLHKDTWTADGGPCGCRPWQPDTVLPRWACLAALLLRRNGTQIARLSGEITSMILFMEGENTCIQWLAPFIQPPSSGTEAGARLFIDSDTDGLYFLSAQALALLGGQQFRPNIASAKSAGFASAWSRQEHGSIRSWGLPVEEDGRWKPVSSPPTNPFRSSLHLLSPGMAGNRGLPCSH